MKKTYEGGCHCGIAPFGHGFVEAIGGAYCSVNIARIDNIEPAELAALPVSYKDGLDNRWWEVPAKRATSDRLSSSFHHGRGCGRNWVPRCPDPPR